MRKLLLYTKNQLKTVQKIEHNLAYMDYAKIFCLQFYWLLVLFLVFLLVLVAIALIIAVLFAVSAVFFPAV